MWKGRDSHPLRHEISCYDLVESVLRRVLLVVEDVLLCLEVPMLVDHLLNLAMRV